MSAYLIWFLLFALFIVVIPIGISPFEAPKVIIAETVISLLILTKLIQIKRAHLKHLFTSQTILLGVILILSLDQILLFRPSNIFGNPLRLQGLFLFWHLILFSFISKDILISQIPRAFYYLSFILLFLATIILGVNQTGRAFGTLGEPNALSATALFIFPFVYFKGNSSIKIAATLIAISIITLSGSRAGLIGLGLEISFITLVNVFKISLIKSVAFVTILIFLILFLPYIEGGGWFENRGQIWQTAARTGFESPILGQGFGNIQNYLHQTAVKLNNPVQYQVVDSAHNFILDFWIQGGIVGIISLFTLLFLSLQGLIRHKKILELTAFLGIITAMMFNPVSVVNLLSFWWLIGQGFGDGA